MWLFFALLAAAFWSIVHVMDSHCVEKIFDRPWLGVITSSLASLLALLLLPFLLPFADWPRPSLEVVFLALVAGALIQISQAFYFQALGFSEAGIVAAYWNMTPVLVPVASLVVLGRWLTAQHYAGIGVLTLASVGFCLLDTNWKARWQSFFLMAVASCMQAAVFLIEKHVFDRVPFLVGFFLITAGLIVTGALPLLSPHVRRTLRSNTALLRRSSIAIILGIEVANLIALACTQRAIDLGLPSLVSAVLTTIPAFTFVLSAVLLAVTSRFGDPRTWHMLGLKILLVSVMVLGVFLVSD